MSTDQDDVFAFLGAPATHRLSGPVTRIDTHGAALFLAGPDVYKVKRAVRFPYMDLSSLEKRRRACEAEITVNRPNAPDLYLGTVPIIRRDDGLHLGGDGAVVEWAVHLRRFDENATLDRLAGGQGLPAELIDRLAQAVVRSHGEAPRRAGDAATASLERVLLDTLDELETAADILPPSSLGPLRPGLTAAFARGRALLLRRGAQGKVRRCHGDLHLRNIVLIGGDPILFDAIEFDEAIATTDTLYDLAFLLMDLCERGMGEGANRLLSRYLWLCECEEEELEGLALLPLFLGLRAAIRAKVTVAQVRLDPQAPDPRDQARAYADAALGFLSPRPPRLVAVGGASGSGKSTLAAAIAPSIGAAPGAVHLRSDVERKRMFAVAPTDRLPKEAYRPEVSLQVYDRLRHLAGIALGAGRAVLLDATYQQPGERNRLWELAALMNLPFTGLWLDAPVALLKRRVADRRNDASDATGAVVEAQSEAEVGALSWHRLDASAAPEAMEAAALALLAPPGPAG